MYVVVESKEKMDSRRMEGLQAGNDAEKHRRK